MQSSELLQVLDFAAEVVDHAAMAEVDDLDERSFLAFCAGVFHKLLLDRGVDEYLAFKLTPKFVNAIAARRAEIGLATSVRTMQ